MTEEKMPGDERLRVAVAAACGGLCLVAGLAVAAIAEAVHQMIFSFLAGVSLGMGISIVLGLTVYYTGERRAGRP
jgi:hypothetical protein